MSSTPLENLLKEDRVFPPPAAFAAAANVNSGIYAEAEDDYVAFWLRQALERLTWVRPPIKALDDSHPPFYRWFPDGEINLSYNCLDRHLETSGDKVAYHWVGEPGDARTLTYRDLHTMVGQFANGLKSLGLKKGDSAALYMGMVPELPIAMLACARIGATHTVIFGGFSAEASRDRVNDGQCKLIVTADGGSRLQKVAATRSPYTPMTPPDPPPPIDNGYA